MVLTGSSGGGEIDGSRDGSRDGGVSMEEKKCVRLTLSHFS